MEKGGVGFCLVWVSAFWTEGFSSFGSFKNFAAMVADGSVKTKP